MSADNRPEAVLFITGWWPSATDPHDGIFVREHALAVHGQREVVVVHLTMAKRPWIPASTIWKEIQDEGFLVLSGEVRTPVRRMGTHDRLVRKAYRFAIQKLSKRFRFSVMHIHVRTPMTEIAPRVGEEFGLPCVVTEHSSFYHTWIHQLDPVEARRSRDGITRWLAQPVIRAVLPVSIDLGRTLRDDFHVAEEKIHVVPNVASPLFESISIEDPPPFRIVLAARWGPPKDPELFIKTLHLLPDALRSSLSIHWVGDGDFIEQAQVECAPFIIQGIMHFTGRLSKADLAPLLAQAHLLVHPTKAENLPCIIIESLCCGTPVLSNSVNGVPELVDDMNGRLTPPEDPMAFAQALRWIMENYAHFDRSMIAQAAQARYSASAVAQQIVNVYDRVTA